MRKSCFDYRIRVKFIDRGNDVMYHYGVEQQRSSRVMSAFDMTLYCGAARKKKESRYAYSYSRYQLGGRG